jgi:hypothetical protein
VEVAPAVCPKPKSALFDRHFSNGLMYSNKRFLAQSQLAGSKSSRQSSEVMWY